MCRTRFPTLLSAALGLLLANAPLRADGFPGCPAVYEDSTGTATFYLEADGTGACSFDASPDPMITAISALDWSDALHCGRCLRVWGPEGSIVVKVVDQCPECPSGHLDLSPAAFDAIADPLVGQVPIAFRSVPCEVAGNLSIKQKEGSNDWWLALQVRDARYAVASVELREDGSALWQPLPRQSYNYFLWQTAGLPVALPADLRITDVHGRSIVEDDVVAGAVTPGLVTTGAHQLPVCDVLLLDGFEGGAPAPLWTSAAP